MRALGVVVDEPGVEIGLERLNGLVKGLAHLHPEELVEHGAVEALHEAVGLGAADLRSPVLDVVELEVELVRVVLAAAELPAVVRQDRFHRQVEVPIEGQHVVVEHRHRGLGLLGDVQKAEGIAAVGVDDGMQVDLAHALEAADEEGVSRQQLPRSP